MSLEQEVSCLLVNLQPRSCLSLYSGSSCLQNTQLLFYSSWIVRSLGSPAVDQCGQRLDAEIYSQDSVFGSLLLPHALIVASLVLKVIFGFPSDLFCFLSFDSGLWQENANIKHGARSVPGTKQALHISCYYHYFVLLKIADHTNIKIVITTQIP